jgi:orotate phosphoribosyltransferase
MTYDIRAQLFEILMRRSFQWGEFTLSSGEKSSYYVDGRQTTLSAEGINAASVCLLDAIRDLTPDLVGGLELGACPLATGVSLAGYRAGEHIDAFYVRKTAKGHGARRRIEGPVFDGARVAFVEDVTTTGASVLDAIDAVRAEFEVEVVRVVTLVDRNQGAAELIRERGYDFHAILDIQRFLDARGSKA